LDWRADVEILAAAADDPAAFAAHILALYRDEALWQSVREGALRRLTDENGREDFARAVASVLEPTAATETFNQKRMVPELRLIE